MGNKHCLPQSERYLKKTNVNEAKNDKEDENLTKILFLGQGNAGKSTIAKQLQSTYGQMDPSNYVVIIQQNIFGCLKEICELADVHQFTVPKLLRTGCEVHNDNWYEPFDIPEEVITVVEEWTSTDEYQKNTLLFMRHLPGNYLYFLPNIRKYASKSFVPSLEDILRSRQRTTGIIELHFTYKSREFIMVDVGSPRSERRKWMHCFSNVNLIMFCCDISSFDCTLFEDNHTMRLDESLALFKEVTSSQHFPNALYLLCFTKMDLFKLKMQIMSLDEKKKYLPNYLGPYDAASVAQYIARKFTSALQNRCAHVLYFNVLESRELFKAIEPVFDHICAHGNVDESAHTVHHIHDTFDREYFGQWTNAFEIILYGMHHDMEIVIPGEARVIKAHRIFMNRFPEITALFETSSQKEKITILQAKEKVTRDIILQLLKFLYTNDLHHLKSDTKALLTAAVEGVEATSKMCLFFQGKLLIEPSLSEHLEHELQSHEFTDAVLSAENRQLRVHKCIVTARCELFALLMNSDISLESKEEVLEMENISFEILQLVVHYLYTNSIPNDLTVTTLQQLLQAADKYMINSLLDTCTKQLDAVQRKEAKPPSSQP